MIDILLWGVGLTVLLVIGSMAYQGGRNTPPPREVPQPMWSVYLALTLAVTAVVTISLAYFGFFGLAS